MASPTYRQWLQGIVNGTVSPVGSMNQQEASALLQVVGDDFGVDGNFISDPYAYTGTDRGQVFSTTQGEGENWGYGPEAITGINDTYQQLFRNEYPGDGGEVQGATTGATGGTTEQQKVLNQSAVDNTRKAIGSLDDEYSIGNQNIDDSFGSLMGRYDRDRSRNQGRYDENTTTNTQNLQKGKQDALVSAAQGRRGLRGVLSSLGALSGDGEVLADRAVTTEANKDIGGATDNYATNAQNLDRAWGDYDEEDKDRRAEAKTARTNQRTALQGSIAGKRQGYYQKLAELFGEVDDVGSATKYLDKAGNLNQTIAQKGRVQSTPFSERKAAFTPGDLESYLAGAGDMTVQTREGGEGGTGGERSLVAGRRMGRGARDEEEERQRELAVA